VNEADALVNEWNVCKRFREDFLKLSSADECWDEEKGRRRM